ncbi:MAG: response regulator [Bacteroidales bacterium]
MRRILVCEDNPIALKTIEFTLQKAGYEVLQACDGEQAMMLLNSELVDMVITDINMPFTKGLELVRYINTRFPNKIPVIIISGINLQETMDHALELGARGYLTKPFDPKQLLEMVHSEIQS